MEQVYLENVRQTFLIPPKDVFYEGMGLQEFDDFVRMLGYIVPNKLTPEELIVYLKFLIKDIKDGVCRFQNSSAFKESFEKYCDEQLILLNRQQKVNKTKQIGMLLVGIVFIIFFYEQ